MRCIPRIIVDIVYATPHPILDILDWPLYALCKALTWLTNDDWGY